MVVEADNSPVAPLAVGFSATHRDFHLGLGHVDRDRRLDVDLPVAFRDTEAFLDQLVLGKNLPIRLPVHERQFSPALQRSPVDVEVILDHRPEGIGPLGLINLAGLLPAREQVGTRNGRFAFLFGFYDQE